MQTGEYAANVGQVNITYDPVTGDVTAYTARNVARVATPDSELVASYPRVARVKQIVDAALANAATVGNQPVGEVDKDVTRAYRTGSYVTGSGSRPRVPGTRTAARSRPWATWSPTPCVTVCRPTSMPTSAS